MKNYLEIMRELVEHGSKTPNRTGVDTLSKFGNFLKFDVSDNLAIVTTKKLKLEYVVGELLWFLVGSSNVGLLNEISGVPAGKQGIWDEWSLPEDFFAEQVRDVTAMIMEISVKTGKTSSVINQEIAELQAQYSKPGQGITEYMQRHGIEQIERVKTGRKGDVGSLYGFQWRKNHVEGTYVDQLTWLIEGLKNDPNSRRHLLVTWSPYHLPHPDYSMYENIIAGRQPIAPCQFAAQFGIKDGKLNTMLHLRSSDVFLGLPYNIMSYALLTHLLAREVGVEPGELSVSLGDYHLYENHLEQAKIQLEQVPKVQPKFKLTDEVPPLSEIMELGNAPIRLKEIVNKIVSLIEDYEPGPLLSAPVAI